jgi:serine phosphatase RsbU (regulator of sigma subunit)
MISIRSGVLTEHCGARYPIGYYNDIEKRFLNTKLELIKGDRFYLFSDGFPDQFGGELGKKFKKRPFKEVLLSIQEMGLVEQQNYLEYILQNWKQGREQTDDILVLALEY